MKPLVMRFILLIVALFSVNLRGQDTWVKTYTPFEEEWIEGIGWLEFDVTYDVEDILVTQDGGFLVSGAFDRSIDDDPPFWWDHWGFLLKTDSDGNFLWADADSVSFMGENDNYAVVETVEGDLISSGRCYFGGGYMIKRDAEGNRIWAMPYDGIGVFSMDTTSDGNIILGGRSDSNPALRKITPDAETIWTSIIDTDSGIIFSITQASDYGYLMTGVNYGDNDILVIKTDADGDSLWTRVFDINGENNQGNCIIKTYDNKILCSGSDGFLGKFEQDGEIIFVNNYNSWNIRTCMETIDSNFILFMAAAIMKIDSDGDSLSFSNFQLYQGVPGIYNSIKELEDGCFVLASSHSSSSIFIIKTDAEGYYTDIKEDKIDFINSINLSNYPNPFNPITIISYNFNKEVMKPILEIYNFKGQEVHSVKLEENDKTYVWDGGGYASGIYFYRIKGDNYNSAVQKMILMK